MNREYYLSKFICLRKIHWLTGKAGKYILKSNGYTADSRTAGVKSITTTLYQGIPAPYFRLITGIRAARNKPKDLALPDRK